jgi:hypothetical protein
MVSQVPQLLGFWHEDETMLQCEGRSICFWEMIDEDTKCIVASHAREKLDAYIFEEKSGLNAWLFDLLKIILKTSNWKFAAKASSKAER